MYIYVYIWPKSAHELLHRLHVCAYLSVYVCAGLRISGVRNRKLTQPFGCSPNWLRAVDRMLTEHIA